MYVDLLDILCGSEHHRCFFLDSSNAVSEEQVVTSLDFLSRERVALIFFDEIFNISLVELCAYLDLENISLEQLRACFHFLSHFRGHVVENGLGIGL